MTNSLLGARGQLKTESLAQESIHLAAVTLAAGGCVNNIKFASYLTGNRPLTCICIIMQRDGDLLRHEVLSMSYT